MSNENFLFFKGASVSIFCILSSILGVNLLTRTEIGRTAFVVVLVALLFITFTYGGFVSCKWLYQKFKVFFCSDCGGKGTISEMISYEKGRTYPCPKCSGQALKSEKSQ